VDQLSRVLNPLRADPRCVLVVGALVGETVSVPQILCPALVGRSRELEASVRMLDAGCGGAVVVLGEAGIGKSRFIRELIRYATDRGLSSFPGVPCRAGSRCRTGRWPRLWRARAGGWGCRPTLS